MKLSEIKQALAEDQIQLTKSLGQNFLHDGNQLRRIVKTSEVGVGVRVLEIGPGLGALTSQLLEAGAQVLAIEKDQRLVQQLSRRLEGAARLDLRHADALVFLEQEVMDWSDWKVVANLPYSVASPILLALARMPATPKQVVVTLQLEVAQRIVSRPGSQDYGVFGLLIQARYDARGYFKIPPTCFFPAPVVDSACLNLVRRREPPLTQAQYETFARLLKQAFSQRRKMMLKLLKTQWPAEPLIAAFAKAGVSPQARAESVSLEQFIELAKELHVSPPPPLDLEASHP